MKNQKSLLASEQHTCCIQTTVTPGARYRSVTAPCSITGSPADGSAVQLSDHRVRWHSERTERSIVLFWQSQGKKRHSSDHHV